MDPSSPRFKRQRTELYTSEEENCKNRVKHKLITTANAMSENRMRDFEKLIQETREVVSVCGEPIERVGAYLLEGLVARKEASGANIYESLKCKEILRKDLPSHKRILYDICPYFKFGYMAANGAIAAAVKNEKNIHIIDFHIAEGKQWPTLIEALAARPGGPPHLRITGIDHSETSMRLVAKMLSEMSVKYNIPIEFHAMSQSVTDVKVEMLDVKSGEATVVNFAFQLHRTPDESVDINNPRDGLLRMVKSLSPRVITLVEQESNTNTSPFLARFTETLDYYSAMFESLDCMLPRNNKDRINVEMCSLARDIVNIVACEGRERVERHEVLGKWRSRMMMAGFKPFPLNSHVNSVIKSLLKCYSEDYSMLETDGILLLGWKERNLVSVSAWY